MFNMTLHHDEGVKAFVRLQEEILKESNDQSLEGIPQRRASRVLCQNIGSESLNTANRTLKQDAPVKFNYSDLDSVLGKLIN
jgi:hypothetical protein